MKTSVELQQFKKCVLLFMAGIICSGLAYALYVIDPVRLIIEHHLQMAPGTLAFGLWKKPPIDVYLKVYIFNITNPKEFLNREEDLKLQEVGPYVYQERLENKNVTWNENGTMTYSPKRTVFYVPEMSVGNPKKDIVTVPNVPILGVSSALHDKGFLVNYPLTQLANLMGAEPILNISVYDYLWGYNDPLIKLAGNIVPSFVNFQKFGLLDRMYDEGDNVINMNIKRNKNMTEENGRYLSIETYNGSPGLSNWGYEEQYGNVTPPENTVCNTIHGATEGTLFPTNLDKNAVFRIFRKAFCRTLPIVFKKETITADGIPVYQYGFADDFLDPPDKNPENLCYCRKNEKCLKKGLSNLTPCYYNIPAAVSLPHFLDADPSLMKGIQGLKADPEKHRTTIYLQPQMGIPIEVHSRVQTNLIMHDTHYNPKIAAFNGLTLPIIWTDLKPL
ncbi:scavenger receptor class B member 1-like isoform X2 [Belonocnema kinseyi]|uniref:scavenger receptor class B member 1-like isoform X2 n=1 Tax=Belonocnema kinseyi TaxID=2817044 RepID=UPI00143D07A9|nr:scavenger receptor class B member 1-like isoform X2 [Belonocnema kinseyi]